MHKDDQMTPNERMAGFFGGKDIDRLPAMPFIVTAASTMAGMTPRELRSSAQSQAKAQMVTYEKTGMDNLSVVYGLHGVGHAFGSEWSNPENGVPAIIHPVLDSLNELDKLDMDKILRKNDPWFQMNYETCQILLDKKGKEVGTTVSVPGPYTAAASCLSVEKFLKATRKKPEKVHELLRICTDAINIIIKEFTTLGVGISLCDPVASCDVISKKAYLDFVLPYTKEIVSKTHEIGNSICYHICGNTNPILKDMLESGCDMLSVDTKVKLADAKQIAGEKVPIVGNVDPIVTMMLGKREDIVNEVKQNLKDCWDSPCGYIPSHGCELPVNTPIENMMTYMEAVRKYAKWPLNPDNFM